MRWGRSSKDNPANEPEGRNQEADDDEWRKKLTPAQFEVLRNKGTERPFTGEYLDMHDDGIFGCAACHAPLFSSDTKFDSRSGWPSFTDVLESGKVELHRDRSFLMERVEVLCGSCGGHLGHVFDDGPGPTGQRYCINSVALDFEKAPNPES